MLALVLAASPPGLQAEVDVTGLLTAAWYVPAGRERLEVAWAQTRLSLFAGQPLDFSTLAYAVPVVGPVLTAWHSSDSFERFSLFSSGVLQALGVAVATARLMGDQPQTPGPLLTFSPVAGGHLGLSVRLTGW